jgi:Family of unknown function (DUF5309)
MPAVIRGPGDVTAATGEVVGLVSTEGVLPEQKVVDMDRTIHMLDLETDQFTTMLDDLGTEVATREKVNWLEDQYAPKTVRLNGAITNAAVSAVLGAAYKDYVKQYDTLRNLQTGDWVRVTAVATDGVTLTLGARAGGATAWATTEDILISGSAFPQGVDVGDLQYIQRVLGYNYGQIHRTAWGFSGTEMEIEQYGGRDPAMEQAKKLVEHRSLLERNAFWGSRGFATVNINDPKPWGQAGGAYEFIVTNKRNANGALTADFVDDFLRAVYSHGSTDKVGYAHPIIGMAFSKFNRTGQGTYWQAEPSNVHGVKVEGFISGAYGYKLPIVVKREWNSIPEANLYGGCMFVIDQRNARRRPMRNRDTRLLTNRQAPGVDGEVNEYLTENSWQFAQESTHGLIYNVTSIAP